MKCRHCDAELSSLTLGRFAEHTLAVMEGKTVLVCLKGQVVSESGWKRACAESKARQQRLNDLR